MNSIEQLINQTVNISELEFTSNSQDKSWVWDQVVKTYNLLFPTDSVVELRCLDSTQGTVAGYYNNPNYLARDAIKWSGYAKGVYITLQRLEPLLLNRSTNTFETYVKKNNGTKNGEIIGYYNILVDFDAVRPAGISATDEEVKLSIETSVACREYLTTLGFPDPLLACSGNGAHLVYAVRLGVEDVPLVKSFLRAIGAKFSTDKVDVDQSVFDPAQLTKLYGTLAKKGTATAERPHRHAQILRAPDKLQIVPRSLLEVVAGCPTDKPDSVLRTKHREEDHWVRQFKGDLRTLDIRGLFEDHNLNVEEDGICDCPWWDEHSEATTGTKLWDAEDGKYPGFHCLHSHCVDRGLREVLEKLGAEDVDRRCSATFSRSTTGAKPVKDSKAGEQETISAKLVDLIRRNAELFRDEDGTPFARVTIQDHKETMPIGSKSFKIWITGMWYEQSGKPLKSDPLKEAVAVIEYLSGQTPRRHVYVRWAKIDGKVYLDLGNDQWEVVEISKSGWKIIDNAPVVFRRCSNTGSFPSPIRGGSLDALRPFFTGDDDAFTLWLGSILTATTTGSYFVTCIHGEQGSAKSWACRFARRLVDPVGKVELTSLPRQIDDNVIKVIAQRHAVCFDNVSSISLEVSDFLCTLVTGGGQQVRTLYTDDELKSYDYKRPVWMNGIPDFTERPDLADRSITLQLPVLSTRADEDELEERWRKDLPAILGGLLDTISMGLRCWDQTPAQGDYRMSKAVRWVNACFGDDRFSRLYGENRESSAETGLDSSQVASILIDYLRSPGSKGCYRGTASELLATLLKFAADLGVELGKGFPVRTNFFSGELRRVAPALRDRRNIQVEFKNSKGTKLIAIKLLEPSEPKCAGPVVTPATTTPAPATATSTITTTDATTLSDEEWARLRSHPRHLHPLSGDPLAVRLARMVQERTPGQIPGKASGRTVLNQSTS